MSNFTIKLDNVELFHATSNNSDFKLKLKPLWLTHTFEHAKQNGKYVHCFKLKKQLI